MFFMEILIVLLAQLTLAVGRPLAIVIMCVALIAAVMLVAWLARRIVDSMLDTGAGLTVRQREVKKREKNREKRLRQLQTELADTSDDDLEQRCLDHPGDELLFDELSNRLRQSKQFERYARVYNEILEKKPPNEASAASTHHHRLADFYMNALQDPVNACRVLERFVDRHPESSEAELTRRGIENLRRRIAER